MVSINPGLYETKPTFAGWAGLNPLNAEECTRYIHHRLRVAGGEADRIFPADAALAVHRLTHGIPREINIVASQAMVNAYVDGQNAGGFMTTPNLETKVHDFLAQKRIAVAGVSRNQSHHPVGNLIYGRLKNTGHDVFPVNPHMQTFEGDRCYPDLQSIPGGVDGVVIITRPEITDRIVYDCAEAKVRRVWMHQSLGKGSSVSPDGRV